MTMDLKRQGMGACIKSEEGGMDRSDEYISYNPQNTHDGSVKARVARIDNDDRAHHEKLDVCP